MRPMAVLIACLLAIAVAVWAIQWHAPGGGLANGEAEDGIERAAAVSETPGGKADDPIVSERVAAGVGEVGVTGRSQRVRVVATLADGQPVAHAEVLYWSARTDSQREADRDRRLAANDLEVALRATGRKVVADEQGIAEIEADEGSQLCIRSGDLYGESTLPDEELAQLDHRVELQRDVTLRMQVVDELGSPCQGIRVRGEGMCAPRAIGYFSERSIEFDPTDPQGIVRCPHFQVALPSPGKDVMDWSLRLWQSSGWLRSADRSVSWQEIVSADPIRLVVPVGGTVVIEVVDADGRPYSCEPRLKDEGSDVVAVAREHDPTRGYVIRQVPLGRTWKASIGEEGPANVVQGPVHVGEVVRVRLCIDARPWEVRGRVLRTDGVVLDGAELQLLGDGFLWAATHCHSNDRGQFRFFGMIPASSRTVDATRLKITHGSVGHAMVAIPERPGPGTTDLGDLVFPVPSSETMLASVEVQCAGRTISDEAWVSVRFQEGDEWKTVPTVSRRDGDHVQLHGTPPGAPMVVCCSHSSCLPAAPVPIGIGAHVVIELRSAAELWLPIVPPSCPADVLAAELIDLADFASGADKVDLQDNCRFHWQGLRPGRYRLRVLAQGRLLHEVPVVELKVGTNVWPADGERLDLRGTARAIHVPAVAADGNAKPYCTRTALPAGATTMPTDESDWPDVWDWFVVQEPRMDLLCRAPGFVPVRLSSPSVDTRVVMRRCTGAPSWSSKRRRVIRQRSTTASLRMR